MKKTLTIFVAHEKVGYFSKEDGRYSFVYDEQYLDNPLAQPLSPRLPLCHETFNDRETRVFFTNLVPEGSLYAGMCRMTHIDTSDKFKFLAKWGRECAGALVFSEDGDFPNFENGQLPLDLSNFYKDRYRRFTIFAGPESRQPRLSMAGGQDKMPVIIDDEKRFWYPLGDTPSTHIVKFNVEGFPHSARNEIFCLHLADRLGLPVAESFLYPVSRGAFACIRRFDRYNGRRLHQIDFCQALGLLPEEKYQEDNPSEDYLQAILAFSQEYQVQTPFGDSVSEYLAKAMCFHYLVKNTDAHCKNFSLLYVPSENGYSLQLSPLYDINSMHIYNVQPEMAMRYGDELNYYKIRWEQFALLADQLCLDHDEMYDILTNMAESISDAASDIAKEHQITYHPAPCYESLVRQIDKTAKNLRQFLQSPVISPSM